MDLNSSDIQKEFDISMLGDLRNIMSYRQFTKQTLDHFGTKYCLNNQRIVIPIVFNKKLVGVTMRRTQAHPVKWLHQPTGLLTGNLIYNYDNIVCGKPLIICEGIFDVFNYWQNGYENAVAMFGCHLTTVQERLLLLAAHEIIVSFDNDNAGRNGTNQVISMLKNKMNIKIANIPDTYDPGMLSSEQINKAIKDAYRIYEWKKLIGG
jgi:DNA primase